MDSPSADATAAFTVAVRTLCEFTARSGDLDLRFTPVPTAMQGMVGHLEVANQRDSQHYEREVPLTGSYAGLRVRGRADGYDSALNRLEEIKTHRGRLERMPANHRALHWAQAKVYGWLMCQRLDKKDMHIALVYYDISRRTETILSEHYTAHELRKHFEALCQRFLGWARQQQAHRAARDVLLAGLRFPHDGFRAGQRALAENVYKANLAGRCLMAQAPTGIGKTVGTLFPLLRATPGQQLDKLVFLTAKTTGRQLALDAMARLRAPGEAQGNPRVLELVARDKACEHPDKACHGDSCPLAQGFYDRLPQARDAALALPAWDKPALRALAAEHAVCPYYLTQDLLRWSDVVVGDYNHYFDVSALVHGLALEDGWRVSLLVDEAHNLVERARKMYTAELDQRALLATADQAPKGLKAGFTRVHRAWDALVRDQEAPYQVYPELPDKLLGALQRLTGDIADHMADHPEVNEPELLAFYFDALHFLRLAELHGSHALFDVSLQDHSGFASSTLCLRNVVPAPMLSGRWQAAHSATLFSATLSPAQYQQDMLGLPDTTALLDVPSPFDASQLQVRVARHISTRWADRAHSLAALVELMAAQYGERPGNYLAFFSSYDYLQMAATQMQACYPHVPLWQQERNMGEAQRGEFLARFTPDGSGLGLAVLGGPFAEGIDLPGTRLIGAFIATLGLPQVNPVNEQIMQCVQANLGPGQGYDYTYLVPGLHKVVQAAGRVIRTPQDQGVVWLMDDRFQRPQVRALLPAWWRVEVVGAHHSARERI